MGGSFPHQGNLESKTKFPNPPHQQTLCLSIMSVCWLHTARHATAQWLCMRSGCARLLFRTLLVPCRLGKSKFSKPAMPCLPCNAIAHARQRGKMSGTQDPGHVPKVERSHVVLTLEQAVTAVIAASQGNSCQTCRPSKSLS